MEPGDVSQMLYIISTRDVSEQLFNMQGWTTKRVDLDVRLKSGTHLQEKTKKDDSTSTLSKQDNHLQNH